MAKYLSLDGVSTLLDGVFKRIRTDINQYAVPSYSYQNGIRCYRYADSRCILFGTENASSWKFNPLSGSYEKNVYFPFQVLAPFPLVTTLYAQGQPVSSCIGVANDHITLGINGIADNVKVNWLVIGSYM